MTENMFDSTHQGMTRSSSLYGRDFLELVMENGEINEQRGSSNRTPSNPSYRTRSNTNTNTPSKDSDLSSSHSHQTNDQNNLQFSQYKKPRMDDSCKAAASNSKKLKYLRKCDKKPAKLNNFSNFLVPKVFIKSTQQAKKSSLAELEEIEVGKGSNKHVSLVARSDEDPPLNENSDAVDHNIAILKPNRKTNSTLYNEPLLLSSPVCSLEASNDPNFCIKKHEDSYESTYSSDSNGEAEAKEKPSQEGKSIKRGRNVKNHNLYEKKGRDKMNKKMRILKELIPNCNKVDKASLLDDAIDYLKNLKLQLQIMSMGNGLCMPQMMLTQLCGAIGINPWSIPQFTIPPPLSNIKDNSLQNMFGNFSNQMQQIPIPQHAPNNFIPMMIENNCSTQLVPTTFYFPTNKDENK
ncbi:hypothetical protein Lal_00004000 [Lupinus albus]|uniref:Putative transcription factor bHLH family n=1 Tax=Lupinus albus TaxID=3870 RepID=A0A6A4PD70_LUPAL|nr:putative transcription factor bHLH family [Lupinus albus]KAF1894082.1 hypothetical protein Lal_00004000 [Lupinus albus]